MRVVLCDDNPAELQKTAEWLEEYRQSRPEYAMQIYSCTNPFDLLTAAEKSGAPDIALLDICMPGLLGTDAVRELQKAGGEPAVIFLTSSSDYAVEAFSLHAHDYLQKPFSKERLFESLDRAAQRRQQQHRLAVQCGKGTYSVDLMTVEYAESRGNNANIYLRSGACLTARVSMTRLTEPFMALPGFAAVGASYVVNLRCVQSLTPTALLMANGDSIPIPRRLRSRVKEQYIDFYKSEAIKL